MFAALSVWFKANKLIGIVALVLLATVAAGTVMHLIDAGNDQAHESGIQTERAATTGKVIENVQKTNATRAAARDPGSCVAYNECLRSARTAANCVRYLPDDEACPVQSGASGGR